MTRIFRLKTAARRFRLMITEERDRIALDLTATAYGDFGDEAELRAWLGPIFAKYEADLRPLVMVNQHSGQTATIGDGVAIIEGPELQ